MGQKVNPVGLRLGINRTWDSRWFARKEYGGLLHEDLRLRKFLTDRLQQAGVSKDRMVIDPGLGYFLGSTPGPSLAALAGIRELKEAFGVPVLVSPSRKSFLRLLTGRDVTRSGPATLAAEIFAAWQGADYIRTHDVAATRDALTLLAAITREAGLA